MAYVPVSPEMLDARALDPTASPTELRGLCHQAATALLYSRDCANNLGQRLMACEAGARALREALEAVEYDELQTERRAHAAQAALVERLWRVIADCHSVLSAVPAPEVERTKALASVDAVFSLPPSVALADALDSAVAIERERCAKVAEELMIYTGPGGEDPERFQQAIATHIRRSSTVGSARLVFQPATWVLPQNFDTLRNAEDVEEQIKLRRHMIYTMVGTLYPSILHAEIAVLQTLWRPRLAPAVAPDPAKIE